MRILQITPTFIPSRFGGVSLFYNLSRNLVKRGHKVVVFTTDIRDRYSRLADIEGERDIDGIKVHYFRNVSNMLATRYRLAIPRGMAEVVKREIGNFDVIHLHNVRTVQNIIVHRYARKYHIPYVLQAHGSLPRIMSKKRLKQVYDSLWGYRLLKDASRVIAVAGIEAEQYKSMGVDEDKIEIIPNGIEPSEFANLPEKGRFRGKHGLGDDLRIVLYLGRIHKIKGLDLLVSAFADLCRSLGKVRLVIAGPDDGYLSPLNKLSAGLGISNEVLLTGHLYGEEKLAAYVDADVFVLPSTYEIFGKVVLEACACGTPVIVTDRCGIASAVDGQAGLVVPYDKEQLRSALLRMLGDDKMRQEFGDRGKLLVRERFNWEKGAEQLEKVYQDVVQA